MLPVFVGVRPSSCSVICNFKVECFACCHMLYIESLHLNVITQGIILTQYLIIGQVSRSKGIRFLSPSHVTQVHLSVLYISSNLDF